MNKFADIIDKNTDMLASWESKSMGQPIGVAKWCYGFVSALFRSVCGYLRR